MLLHELVHAYNDFFANVQPGLLAVFSGAAQSGDMTLSTMLTAARRGLTL